MSDKEAKEGCFAVSVISFFGLFIVFGCFGGCSYLSSVERSDGYRDGVIQKLSHKGVVWKTHEGEMALEGFRVRGESTSNTFEFTVSDAGVWDELQKLDAGQRVRLHYKQFVMTVPWSGSTTYRVVKVEKLK